MAIFSAIGVLGALTKSLASAYTARLAAKGKEAQLNADQRIELLKAQRDVLVAEADNRLTSWIRPYFAGLFAIYLSKVLLWDKVLGWGTTDTLSPMLNEIMMVIIGFYFLARPFEKIWKRK